MINHHPVGRRRLPLDGPEGVELEARCQVRRLLRRLREERERQGLTQHQRGEQCGIKPQTVTKLERGHAGHPEFLTLYRLAKALGMDMQIRLCRPKKG